jgi:NAD(P)H-hydrate epimerase
MTKLIEVPALSLAQWGLVDEWLTTEYGITLAQRTERAGYQLAHLARKLLDDDLADRPVVVLAGHGNKGGAGLAAARHLLDGGAWVQVVLTDEPDTYRGEAAQQLASAQSAGVPLAWAEEGWELPPTDLVIDALVGDGLQGAPQSTVRTLIQLANSSVASILSLSEPSGLAASGELFTPHVRASATMTLALPKQTLLSEPGINDCGDLYVADIGVASVLYARLGLAVPPLFARDSVRSLSVIEGRAYLAEG